MKYSDPSGELFIEAITIAMMIYQGGMQANFTYSSNNGGNPFNPGDWNWNSAHTYIGMVGGAFGGANMLGYNILNTQIPGIISNGILQAGIQVGLNGVGNLTDGNNFFDNWYWSAGIGFLSGGIAGYQLSNERGLNYWWGTKPGYRRTQWSLAWWDKPHVLKFRSKPITDFQGTCINSSYLSTHGQPKVTVSEENFIEVTELNFDRIDELYKQGYTKIHLEVNDYTSVMNPNPTGHRMPGKKMKYIPGKYWDFKSFDPGVMYPKPSGGVYAPIKIYDLLNSPFKFDKFLLFR
jgi:hypothetical protein